MFFNNKNTLLTWMKTYMKCKDIYQSDNEDSECEGNHNEDFYTYFLQFNTGGMQTSILDIGTKLELKDEKLQQYIDLIGEINIIES